jgi:hypothetical protein
MPRFAESMHQIASVLSERGQKFEIDAAPAAL